MPRGVKMWQEFSGWEHESRNCWNAAFIRKTPSRYCFHKVNMETSLSSWSKRYGSLLIIEVGAVKAEAYAYREKRRDGRILFISTRISILEKFNGFYTKLLLQKIKKQTSIISWQKLQFNIEKQINCLDNNILHCAERFSGYLRVLIHYLMH